MYATGVAIVTALTADKRQVGMTVNSLASVSLDPALLLWSVNRAAPSHQDFLSTPAFAVNILSAKQQSLADRFGRAGPNKFADVRTLPGICGIPVIEDTLATFECTIESLADGGDHTVVIGRVWSMRRAGGEPLLFFGGQYTRIGNDVFHFR